MKGFLYQPGYVGVRDGAGSLSNILPPLKPVGAGTCAGNMKWATVEEEFKWLRDGSFAVFQEQTGETPDGRNYVLVVKFNGHTEYKPILSDRDTFFGFSEPLAFESLGDLLRAENDSQAGTGGRLVYPGLAYKLVDSHSGVIRLFKRLIDLTVLKAQQNTELTDRKWTLHGLEKDLANCSKRQKGFAAVTEMLKNQTTKHKASESCNAYPAQSAVFSANYEKIVARQNDVATRQQETAAEIAELEAEYTRVSAQYSHSLEAVHDTHREQEDIIRTLSVTSEREDYIEGLISSTDDDRGLALQDQATWYSNDKWQEKSTNRLLAGKPDGTFLVSPSKKYPEVPYILSVAYDSPKFDRRVHFFKVFMSDGCLGLELPGTTMCIFDRLTDLVVAFSRIPFRVVNANFSLLTLTYPVGKTQPS